MSVTDRTNEAWLIHLRGGDSAQQAALTDLRVVLTRRLRRGLTARGLSDDALLEDTVQDAIVRILDRLDQFQGRSKFLTWATSVAIRVAMSELRRRHWQNVSLEQLTSNNAITAELAGRDPSQPELNWERQSILSSLQTAIDTELTERQRLALVAELRGMPQDEIAQHLGSNRNAIYKLTHDARKRLRSALQAAGYEAVDVQAAFTN